MSLTLLKPNSNKHLKPRAIADFSVMLKGCILKMLQSLKVASPDTAIQVVDGPCKSYDLPSKMLCFLILPLMLCLLVLQAQAGCR